MERLYVPNQLGMRMKFAALLDGDISVHFSGLYPVKVTDVEQARRIGLMQVSLKAQSEIRRVQEGKH